MKSPKKAASRKAGKPAEADAKKTKLKPLDHKDSKNWKNRISSEDEDEDDLGLEPEEFNEFAEEEFDDYDEERY
jgi:hypothetical protein